MKNLFLLLGVISLTLVGCSKDDENVANYEQITPISYDPSYTYQFATPTMLLTNFQLNKVLKQPEGKKFFRFNGNIKVSNVNTALFLKTITIEVKGKDLSNNTIITYPFQESILSNINKSFSFDVENNSLYQISEVILHIYDNDAFELNTLSISINN